MVAIELAVHVVGLGTLFFAFKYFQLTRVYTNFVDDDVVTEVNVSTL